MEAGLLDSIISRLLEFRQARLAKQPQVQLSENEIRQLCAVSRDIFLQQPNLLELEAPIKICGKPPSSFPFTFHYEKELRCGFLGDSFNWLHLNSLSRIGDRMIQFICLFFVRIKIWWLWIDGNKNQNLGKVNLMLVGKIIGSSNLYRDSIIFYVLFDREDKMLFMELMNWLT